MGKFLKWLLVWHIIFGCWTALCCSALRRNKLQAALAFALKLTKQLKRFYCTIFEHVGVRLILYFYFLVKLSMLFISLHFFFLFFFFFAYFFLQSCSFHEWKVANVIWLQQIIMQCLIPAFKFFFAHIVMGRLINIISQSKKVPLEF